MINEVWNTYMHPFRVAGNLYFVGTKIASSHIIDTGDGLIMIDSGYQETLYLVIDSIHKLGFSPHDIKLIVHSHGHIDHMGGTKSLAVLSGAKTVIGRADENYANGKRDLSFATELGMVFSQTFEPDTLIDDRDIIKLGNTVIHCLHTPGHTEGTMSYFFELDSNGRKLIAGTHGGVGMNSMETAFLKKHGLPFSLRQSFLEGLSRLRKQHVDVFFGNHQDQCNTIDKSRRILTGDADAFIDASQWPLFLDKCEENIKQLMAKGEKI